MPEPKALQITHAGGLAVYGASTIHAGYPVRGGKYQGAKGLTMPDEIKVVFDDAQQAKVNALIIEAQGRAAAETRAALATAVAAKEKADADLATARAALAAAPKALSAADQTELTRALAQMDEIKSAAATAKAESDRILASAQADRNARDAALASVASIKKENAITAAAQSLGFVKPEMVAKMTSDAVKISADGVVSIVKPDGTVKLNNSLEPMTLQEFYTEFAKENPFMVRGEVRPGTGAFEALGRPSLGQYKLEDLFGAKSNSKLVNDLSLRDPKTYKELRVKAVAQGLVLA